MLSASERAFDHMTFELPRIVFAHRPAPRRLSHFVHRLRASGNQIMPFRQGLTGCTEPIRASLGQPVQGIEIVRIELHTIRDELHAMLVIEATPVAPIKQLAGDVRRVEDSRVFVFELVDATATATIAKRLPLASIEFAERLLPKGPSAFHETVHDRATLALLDRFDQAGARGLNP